MFSSRSLQGWPAFVFVSGQQSVDSDSFEIKVGLLAGSALFLCASVWLSEACALTEPSAVAPDARVNSGEK
jgi:hypothetical protein